MIHSIIR